MKNLLSLIAIALTIFITSCTWFQNLVDTNIKDITKNECDILVFKDSTHFLFVYSYLEQQLEDYENSSAIQNNPDEEKPLTDFEILKSHNSYRKDILDQENIAENNGVDLSVNPINEILEDDVILQTLLNKDRFLIIDGTVYYYYDDCTLYKFPVGLECQRTIPIAIKFFEKLQTNPLEKSPFAYNKIDICNGEENYLSLKNGDPCQSINLEVCAINECHPETVNLFITFPGLYQSIYTLTSCKYTINATSTTLSVNSASAILSNPCGFSVGVKGFTVVHTLPPNGTYNIKIEAGFSYEDDDPKTPTQTCITILDFPYKVPPPCPIKYTETVNNTMVTINVTNPCNSQPGGFSFIANQGTPNVISGPPQTPNSIVLEYKCAGKKDVIINYSLNGCQNSKSIKVYPVQSLTCCTNGNRYKCSEPSIFSTDQNQTHKINIKLKERKRVLVAIVKNFKKSNNKYKRAKTNFQYDIFGSVYYYTDSDGCDCGGKWANILVGMYPKKNKQKIRARYRFRKDKNAIEGLPDVNNDFGWFLKNWSREKDDPWKFSVQTTDISKKTVMIDCVSNNCTQ